MGVAGCESAGPFTWLEVKLDSGNFCVLDETAAESALLFEVPFVAAMSSFPGSWRFSAIFDAFFDARPASTGAGWIVESEAELECSLAWTCSPPTNSGAEESMVDSMFMIDLGSTETISLESFVDSFSRVMVLAGASLARLVDAWFLEDGSTGTAGLMFDVAS